MERLKRIQFWGKDENDDRLVRQVLKGKKTATVDILSDFHKSFGEYDDGSYEEGDIVEVYDLKQKLRCKIEISEIYPAVFGDIPEKLWRGEGNLNEEEFRKDHISCWSNNYIDDNFELMAIHFKLVEKIE